MTSIILVYLDDPSKNAVHNISCRSDVKQAQVVIDSYYYGCITEVAAMMQAFVHPSKVRINSILY